MDKNDLFDMDAFWLQYGDLPYPELLHHRNRLLYWINEYQAREDVPSDDELFGEFCDKQIEVALLAKLIHTKTKADFSKPQ